MVDRRVELPRVCAVDCVLDLGLLGEQRVEIGARFRELRRDVVEAVEQVPQRTHAVLDVLAHRPRRVELRLLLEQADGRVRGELGDAGRRLFLPGHDPQDGRLARAVGAEHADLRAREERERDVRQDLPVRAVELVDPVHGEDVFAAHRGAGRYRNSFQTLHRGLTNPTYRGFVKKQLALLVAALVTVLVLAGQLARAAAGPEPSDIQDSQPYWASDGVHLAFERTAPNLQHVLTSTSAGKEQFVAWQSGQTRGYVGSRYFLVEQGDQTIVTTGGRFAGPNAILHGTEASASPDGTQIAYVRGGTLYVVQTRDIPPGGAFPIPSPPERALAKLGGTPSDAVGPAWSRDGRQIAVASGGTLFTVATDGSGSRALAQGANPSWAPDGQTIA